MSDKQNQAEPSGASAGSHPFWAWWSHDLGIGHFADSKSRAIAYRGEIFPLYRQPQPALTDEERAFLELRANRLYSQTNPTLTDEEREALEWAAQMAGNNVYFRECDTLRALLARLK